MKATIALAREGKIKENASIRDQRSIIINAPIDKVWSVLTDVGNWSNWNQEVKNLKLSTESAVGSEFQWKIGKMNARSVIQLMDANQIFSITCKSSLVERIYVWTLEEDEAQTIATVSTSLQGLFAILIASHQEVHSELLNWLECLKQEAEKS